MKELFENASLIYIQFEIQLSLATLSVADADNMVKCRRRHSRLFCGLVECCFTSTETVGLLGTGAQDGHLDFHTTPEFCGFCVDRFYTALFSALEQTLHE